MEIHERLEEMGLYYRMGGTSADVSGSNTLARLVEGDAGGEGGSGMPGFAFPWVASRVAETARAVLALHADDQSTVATCYCEPLANQALQASALGIKVSALQKRLHRIHLILEDWLSPEAKEARRVADRAAEAAANLRASEERDAAIRARAAAGATGEVVHAPGRRKGKKAQRKARRKAKIQL